VNKNPREICVTYEHFSTIFMEIVTQGEKSIRLKGVYITNKLIILMIMRLATDKFPPFLIVELALKILRKTFLTKLGFRPSLSKTELDSILKSIESSLMILKYSYLSLDDIISHEEMKNICSKGNTLLESLKPAAETQSTHQLSLSLLNWGILILIGLERRIKVANDQLGAGVDLKILRVRNVQKQGSLLLTRAYDDKKSYTIMTNMLNLQSNRNLAAAFLPPLEIGGQLSDAMYLGDDEYEEEAGTFLNPAEVNLREANAILRQLIGK
jgi:predicted RNA-binding protein with EMAP domain